MNNINSPGTYQQMYDTAVIQHLEVVQLTANAITSNKERYESVGGGVIPWQFIGVIHYREASLSFKTHLHNGDSLLRRTINVPKGRPLDGEPPFTWEHSAKDALGMKNLYLVTDWSISEILALLEQYNGLGYARYYPEVHSPYLWSYTSYYQSGKYDRDGHFNSDLVDKQIGCVPLLKVMGV